MLKTIERFTKVDVQMYQNKHIYFLFKCKFFYETIERNTCINNITYEISRNRKKNGWSLKRNIMSIVKYFSIKLQNILIKHTLYLWFFLYKRTVTQKPKEKLWRSTCFFFIPLFLNFQGKMLPPPLPQLFPKRCDVPDIHVIELFF